MSALLGPALLREVEEHVASDVEREVGGVLVGTINNDVASVSAVIPALAAVGSKANVTFTQEVWEDVHRCIDRDHPDCSIVGWYHSHPGFGIFLSAYDLFIHENFFPAAGQVALVVDPLGGEAGWFGWRDGSVVEFDRFAVRSLAGVTGQDQAHASARSTTSWRTGALLGLPLVAIAAFSVGQLLNAQPDLREDDPPPAATETEQEVGQESAEPQQDMASDLAEMEEQLLELEEDLEATQTHAQQLEAVLAEIENSEASGTDAVGNPPEDHTFFLAYTVRAGDTLWKIADVFYGQGEAWTRIADANPDVEPASLLVGSELQLPVSSDEAFEVPGPDSDSDDNSD